MEIESKLSGNPPGVPWTNTLIKIASLILLIVLANLGISWLVEKLELQFWPEHVALVERVVLAGIILYICLMALPFLPGIEIGLALMIMLGPLGILIIYLCTLISLTISFGLGRLVPANVVTDLLRWLHLPKAEQLLKDFNATPPENRLAFIAENIPTKMTPTLLKQRYLVLALLLNLPGNALLGGGGGIGMLAGMSRLYSFPKYLLLISVAILPGPILVLLSKFI